MLSRTSLGRRLKLFVLALAVAPLAAGCSSYRYRPDRSYVVQRPAYDNDGTKAIYLGGYAGANYDYGPRAAR